MIGFLLFITGFSAMVIGTYLLLRPRKQAAQGEYIWVGEGDNPFK